MILIELHISPAAAAARGHAKRTRTCCQSFVPANSSYGPAMVGKLKIYLHPVSSYRRYPPYRPYETTQPSDQPIDRQSKQVRPYTKASEDAASRTT